MPEKDEKYIDFLFGEESEGGSHASDMSSKKLKELLGELPSLKNDLPECQLSTERLYDAIQKAGGTATVSSAPQRAFRWVWALGGATACAMAMVVWNQWSPTVTAVREPAQPGAAMATDAAAPESANEMTVAENFVADYSLRPSDLPNFRQANPVVTDAAPRRTFYAPRPRASVRAERPVAKPKIQDLPMAKADVSARKGAAPVARPENLSNNNAATADAQNASMMAGTTATASPEPVVIITENGAMNKQELKAKEVTRTNDVVIGS